MCHFPDPGRHPFALRSKCRVIIMYRLYIYKLSEVTLKIPEWLGIDIALISLTVLA